MMTFARRLLWPLLILGVPGGVGCGSGSSGDLAPGCYSGDTVPGPVRRSLEEAAALFFERIRVGEIEAIYEEAASQVQKQRSDREFLEPIVRVVGSLGPPGELQTERMAVVRFGAGYPYAKEAECRVPGRDQPMILTLSDHPVQASLVQRGQVGPELFYYSTLWHQEKGSWRLAAFMVKPASLSGEGWKTYAKIAATQREKRNDRNAALLYNVAINLLVANAWSRPAELEDLRAQQSRISVTQLPVNSVDAWIDTPDTFKVFSSSYTMDSGKLAVAFRYQSPFAIEDTTVIEAYSARLRDYVTESFPEYPEVFSRLVLVATDPGDPDRSWASSFPLGPAP